jgi:tRNA modification GTPase
MRFDTESTICAIATGTEGAFRGAIRVTGPDSLSVVSKALSTNGNELFLRVSRASRLQRFVELPVLGAIDVDVFVWPDGRSYTGQPSVELHCLGNTVILQSLQSRLIECGAVFAQPGEFTLRAFLAGRLDLTQCEAVLGVIHAANDQALNVALSQLAGGLSGPLSGLRTSLVELLADIEAGLDFVDEDISFISPAQILVRLDHAIAVVNEMLHQMESRAAQTVALQVAIVGAPNAGKSSLLNEMANRQVSIVSPEPGTTRDYVRLRMSFDGVTVDVLDTAGLETLEVGTPRALAQGFTEQQIENADLVLFCLSVDDPESAEWPIDRCRATTWLVRTKCDLKACDRRLSRNYEREFSVSTQHRGSVDRIVNEIGHWAATRMACSNEVVPLTAARCRASLVNAAIALGQAKEAAEGKHGDEIIASELRLSLDEIGLVAGAVYTDDILDALFSRFCIGK